MTDDLYPLRFEPYFKEFVWGGRKLETLFKKALPAEKLIGESWEVYDANRILNGPLAGRTLADVVERYGDRLLGRYVEQGSRFPLLLKLSATELDLSVQVHPNDAQAERMEPGSGFSGKTEMLYILSAEPGARVFYGLSRRMDRGALQYLLARPGGIVDVLQQLAVQPGDVIFVPPGTVHAYGAGLVYFELQQTSDITYRMYDWDRVDSTGRPRQLHVDKALDVINDEAVSPPRIQPVCLHEDYGLHCFLVASRHFVVDRLELTSPLAITHPGGSFHILCVVGGSATLHAPSTVQPETTMGTGDVVLLPASTIEYRLVPETACQVLRSYVPDLKHDVVDYLLGQGILSASIAALGGGISSGNDLAPLLPASH